MKNLIFMVVILQLGISIHQTNGFSFGDIISVERKPWCLECLVPAYKHYAIYVGEEKIEGKQPGQNIFHFSGPNKEGADCIFGKLEDDPGKFEVDNYLDGPDVVIDRRNIIKRIVERHRNCGDYKLANNNCEHLATYVRYGEPQMNQHGTLARFPAQCTRLGRDTTKSYRIEAVAVSCDEQCPVKGKRKPG